MPFNIKDVVKETATQRVGTVEDIRHGGVTLYYLEFTKFPRHAILRLTARSSTGSRQQAEGKSIWGHARLAAHRAGGGSKGWHLV